MGTTFADDLRADIDDIRSIPDADLGIRQNSLSVLVRVWSGARVGQGTKTDTLSPITTLTGNRYKVEHVSQKEIALSAGKYQSGTLKVGPITPPYQGSVVTFQLIDPNPGPMQEVYYRLDDGAGALLWCKKVSFETDNALHWYLYLNPTGAAPL